MKARMFLSLTAILFSVTIWSQGTVFGTVVNEKREPLVGAKITVYGTYFLTYSGIDGKFSFEVNDAEYIGLVVTYPGYEPREITYQPGKSSECLAMLIPSTTDLAELVIRSTRVVNEPMTYSTVSKEALQKRNFGQDLPYLLDQTPSAVTTSDAGAGVGYTGLRIRGVDPTRTNVTINGIPINDAESHGVFWVNMPDFASSVQDIQIQRGVGTSANGAAAFGASINIKTDNLSRDAYAELDNSYGSFNTMKNTIKVGTGQLKERFYFDARLSNIQSDGFIDRASSNLKSFFLQGQWVGKKTSVKANAFVGKEITYQSWWGTPESRVTGDVAAMNAYADRNFLSDADRENLLNSGRTYNYYTYDNQVDHYQQDHYQLHVTHRFTNKLILNVSGHYTYGRGYYEEYKADQDLANYGLKPVILNSDTINSTDLIRRKWLNNHFYGGVFALQYTGNKGFRLTWGGAVNSYDGDHYGEIVWAEFASNSEIRQRYYFDNARKSEISSYLKANYIWKKFNLYGDLQYRFIDYSYLGTSEVNGSLVESQEVTTFSFVNPKVGLSYDVSKNAQLYASFAIGNREPVRDDFRQPVGGKKPTSELLQNTELGYRFQTTKVFLRANAYLMDYTNQLILTGQINDVGGYTRTNVKDSYRAGIELEAGYSFGKGFNVSGNIAFSQNKVKQFIEYGDDYDNGGQYEIQHKNTDLAFSPNVVGALIFAYETKRGFDVSWTAKYVGKQFLDNTSNDARSIDAYFVNHLGINYRLPFDFCKEIKVGLMVNNILNQVYENNGYTYSYFYGGTTTTENFYYPQAGIQLMGRVTMKF